MQDSNMNYMQMMNLPKQYTPMMEMPQQELESMYPRCYYIINPEVERMCNMMCKKYGPMFNPNPQMLESMVDDIDNRVGADVDSEYQDFDKCDDRQFVYGGFGGGRRRFRRDLITILLLRSLLRRRPSYYPWGYGY